MAYLAEDIPGGFGKLKKIGSVLAALAEDHAELVLLELREEKLNMIGALLFLTLGLCLALAALITVTALVVLILPPDHQLTGLGLLTGLYLAAAGIFLWGAFRKLNRLSNPISTAMEEIRKDLHVFEKTGQ